MRRCVLSLVLLAMCGWPAQAQRLAAEQPPTRVYLEAFGPGGFYSFNFERTLIGNLSGRVGAAYIPQIAQEHTAAVQLPIQAVYLFGIRNHHLETGFGLTIVAVDRQTEVGRSIQSPHRASERTLAGREFFPAYTVGYRYQKPGGGLLFRVSYTPVNTRNEGWINHGGVSIGYGF